MIQFQVDDMTCGHCASTITRTVQGLDAGAQALQAAITDAGFTPVPLVALQPVAAARSGCCGSCGGM